MIKYIVMKQYSWDVLEVNGMKLKAVKGGPDAFIPVFDTMEQAVKWCDGDPEAVIKEIYAGKN